MTALIRLRLLPLLLALAMSLGGSGGAFARPMATVDDLAVVEAMAVGATAADFCGRDGKALLAGASAQLCLWAVGSPLPDRLTVPRPLARSALYVVPPRPAALPVLRPRDPAHASRAPPQAVV